MGKYNTIVMKEAFKKEQPLFFELNPKFILGKLRDNSFLLRMDSRLLVKIILKEDLNLISRRYRKKAKLCQCKCYVPSLRMEAASLNHAFREIRVTY